MNAKEDKKDKKPLSLSGGKKLTLGKKLDSNPLQQNVSRGRSKTVTFEVKRKRAGAQDSGREPSALEKKFLKSQQNFSMGQKKEKDAEVTTKAPPTSDSDLDREDLKHLTNQERERRIRVLEAAKKKSQDERLKQQKLLEDEALRKDQEKEKLKAEEANKKAQEEERKDEAVEVAIVEDQEKKAVEQPIAPEESADLINKKLSETKTKKPTEEEAKDKKVKKVEKKPAPVKVDKSRRRSGKLTIAQALDEDYEDQKQRSLASVRRAREKLKAKASQETAFQPKEIIREVVLPEVITVQELANRMAVRGSDVIKALMKMGEMMTINQAIDADTAELLISEFGHKTKRVSEADVEIGLKGKEDKPEDLLPRPAVVTVMGHVDHGKTSLLDSLRETNVVSREAGGITQHIGAYQVTLGKNQAVTFLDTPGHEAFTAMRARGANVTDIVILVVAADDGIQPQTIEAINHAKAANVPIIVAVNKIDKPEADPVRIKTDLLNHEIQVEELGGDILSIDISAKQKTNIDKLLETLLLQAELLELKANPNREAEGIVVEAKLEQGRGSVATVLVQRGTLKIGDIIIAGDQWGRVRALVNDLGENIKSATPSQPVEILGLQATPSAGDEFHVVKNENRAREITEYRQNQKRKAKAAIAGRGNLEQMFSKIKDGQASEFSVIVKTDVQGSAEAIVNSLEKLSTDEVTLRVIHAAVGVINETDINLAKASNAFVAGFNVRATSQARDLAQKEDITIKYYSVIYEIVQDSKDFMSGMLSPTIEEDLIGHAEIRNVFNISKVGKVAGCRVTDGLIKRGAKVRILRDNVVVYEGTLKTLKHVKDEVKEIKEGYECGMTFENYNDIKPNDVVECYDVKEIKRTL